MAREITIAGQWPCPVDEIPHSFVNGLLTLWDQVTHAYPRDEPMTVTWVDDGDLTSIYVVPTALMDEEEA